MHAHIITCTNKETYIDMSSTSASASTMVAISFQNLKSRFPKY